MPGKWFPYTNAQGVIVQVRWWDSSPRHRAASCDRCHRRVLPDEPRCQVDDGGGPDRKGGHGKKHTWLCTLCAANIRQPMEQQGLFDE